jgi:hypothetical protein
VPSDNGSMPWSDIEVLIDRVREADDALDRARAYFRSAPKAAFRIVD